MLIRLLKMTRESLGSCLSLFFFQVSSAWCCGALKIHHLMSPFPSAVYDGRSSQDAHTPEGKGFISFTGGGGRGLVLHLHREEKRREQREVKTGGQRPHHRVLRITRRELLVLRDRDVSSRLGVAVGLTSSRRWETSGGLPPSTVLLQQPENSPANETSSFPAGVCVLVLPGKLSRRDADTHA